ncbi:hypothetical protein [Halosimplex halobium]|uniref:hypothetical protein n=1 Tax=Halosimplex halobium TaxID=3396618 RepID=UPI003F546D13
MSEFHATLYGDDAERATQMKDRLDQELPGSVASNAEMVRTLLDLAEESLE